MLTGTFGGDPSDSASTFFKMASAYANFFYDNDFHVIMTTKASEVVQKVPTDEKYYHKCSLYAIVSI